MPNRSTDALFQLVKSLEKSEKRNFKLYVKRNSATVDLKIIHLFDALDKMTDYDEEALLPALFHDAGSERGSGTRLSGDFHPASGEIKQERRPT